MFNIPHQPVYAIFAIAYASSFFEFDKVLISAVLAIGYTVLTLSRH